MSDRKDMVFKLKNNNIWNAVKANMGIIIALIVIVLLLSIFTDVFLTANNLYNVLRQITINVFLSCGMTLVIISGNIDLSVGAVIASSGCICAGLLTNSGFPAIFAIIVAVASGALVGLISGLIVSKTTIPSFIVTLAMMNICRGFARLYTDCKTITVRDDVFNYLGSGYIGEIPIHVFYMVAIIAIIGFILYKTQLGRHIYASGDNKQAAVYSGINVQKTTLIVFLICGICAGLGGVITVTRMVSARYTIGEGAEMDAISAVIIGGTSMAGGVGRLSGTIIGCLIIGVLNNGMNLLGIDSSWQYVVQGIVILVAVFIDFFKKGKKA